MLSDPAAVWRTIAHDLAWRDDSFASLLVEVLKSGRVDAGRPDIASHFDSLIMEPLTKRHEHSPSHAIPVIVIDALDECGNAKERRNLLTLLAKESAKFPSKFRMLITSRAERDI